MSSIRIVDYDPQWPRLFDEQKRLIADVIGDLAGKIEHIGSTSVPGLCAKPKIDIDAVLRDDRDIEAAVKRVQALNAYIFHGDAYDNGMWSFTRDHGSCGTRLYLCGPGNPVHVQRVLFRDWLRKHPADAADYAALKRRLAAAAMGNWTFYTGGKAEFVSNIVRQASALHGQDQEPHRRISARLG